MGGSIVLSSIRRSYGIGHTEDSLTPVTKESSDSVNVTLRSESYSVLTNQRIDSVRIIALNLLRPTEYKVCPLKCTLRNSLCKILSPAWANLRRTRARGSYR